MAKESEIKDISLNNQLRNSNNQHSRARRKKHRRYVAKEDPNKKLKETVNLIKFAYLN